MSTNKPIIKAAIFDLDGTIIDSEHLNYKKNRIVFKEICNLDISKEEYIQRWLLDQSFTRGVIRDYNLNIKPAQLLEKKLEINRKLVDDELELMPYAEETLKAFFEAGYKIGMTTSNNWGNLPMIFEKFPIQKYFHKIITYEDVKNPKPHPEPYQKTAKALGEHPKNCVVFEDNPAGVRSAKEAGIGFIVGVPCEYTKNMEFSEADLVISNLRMIHEYPHLIPLK